MNQWSFVIAAYAITLASSAILAFYSWRGMRAAERAAEELSSRA